MKTNIIAIIDRDVRQYRNTLPSEDNLLVLKYYSYETHLITDKTLKKLIEQMTRVPASYVTDAVIDYIKNEYSKQNDELYYFSLEALKASLDASYVAEIKYGDSAGVVTGGGKVERWRRIAPKQSQLDQFAQQKNISKNDMKYITKGKWYLYSWCEFLIMITKELHSLCGRHIGKCAYCANGHPEKCQWRISSSYQIPQLISSLNTRQYMDLDEVKYISDFMKSNLNCS